MCAQQILYCTGLEEGAMCFTATVPSSGPYSFSPLHCNVAITVGVSGYFFSSVSSTRIGSYITFTKIIAII